MSVAPQSPGGEAWRRPPAAHPRLPAPALRCPALPQARPPAAASATVPPRQPYGKQPQPQQQPQQQQQQPHNAQLPRFYIAEPLAGRPPGWLARLEPGEARHTRTLRLGEGSRLELCDGRGSVVEAELEGPAGREGGLLARTVAEPTEVGHAGGQAGPVGRACALRLSAPALSAPSLHALAPRCFVGRAPGRGARHGPGAVLGRPLLGLAGGLQAWQRQASS